MLRFQTHQGIRLGTLLLAAIIALGACGSTSSNVQVGSDPAADPHSQPSGSVPGGGPPSTAPPFSASIPDSPLVSGAENARPDDAPLKDPFVNKNEQTSPIGTACWALTDLAHMLSSFAVPMQDSKPLYTNEYIQPDTRQAAVAATLERVEMMEMSVVSDLPEAAQTFVNHLIRQTSDAAAYLKTKSDGMTLTQLQRSIGITYFSFDKFPGFDEFGKVASASKECAL